MAKRPDRFVVGYHVERCQAYGEAPSEAVPLSLQAAKKRARQEFFVTKAGPVIYELVPYKPEKEVRNETQ